MKNNGDPMEARAPTPLTPDARAPLEDATKKIADLKQHINYYLAGLRSGMGLPPDWIFDFSSWCFVPPGGAKIAEPTDTMQAVSGDAAPAGIPDSVTTGALSTSPSLQPRLDQHD